MLMVICCVTTGVESRLYSLQFTVALLLRAAFAVDVFVSSSSPLSSSLTSNIVQLARNYEDIQNIRFTFYQIKLLPADGHLKFVLKIIRFLKENSYRLPDLFACIIFTYSSRRLWLYATATLGRQIAKASYLLLWQLLPCLVLSLSVNYRLRNTEYGLSVYYMCVRIPIGWCDENHAVMFHSVF